MYGVHAFTPFISTRIFPHPLLMRFLVVIATQSADLIEPSVNGSDAEMGGGIFAADEAWCSDMVRSL